MYVKAWVFGQSYRLKDSQDGQKVLPCLSSNCTDGIFTCDLVAKVCTTPEDQVFQDAYATQQALETCYSEIPEQANYHAEEDYNALLSWRQ